MARTRVAAARVIATASAALALACLAPAGAAAQASLRGAPRPCPDCYHSTDDVLGWLREASAAAPRYVTYEAFAGDAADAALERTMPVVTLTDTSAPAAGKERVLMVFGEHSREVITSEVALWFVRAMLDAVGVDTGALGAGREAPLSRWAEFGPALDVFAGTQGLSAETVAAAAAGGAKAAWGAAIRRALLGAEIVIVPVENAAGRRDIEGGRLCDRVVRATGVDLNRNWPYMWKRSPSARRSETYGGPEPLSEFESRAVLALARRFAPLRSYVNVHSGEWALYVPWDHKSALAAPTDGLAGDAMDVLHAMNRFCRCKAGAAGAVSGYLAFGTSMDYMFTEMRVPYPITVEVFGDHNEGRTYAKRGADAVPTTGDHARSLASFDFLRPGRGSSVGSGRRCYTMFNPLSQAEYRGAVMDWVAALMVLVDRMAADGAAGAAEATAGGASVDEEAMAQRSERAAALAADNESALRSEYASLASRARASVASAGGDGASEIAAAQSSVMSSTSIATAPMVAS
eukprot:PRCOL_00005708-RA